MSASESVPVALANGDLEEMLLDSLGMHPSEHGPSDMVLALGLMPDHELFLETTGDEVVLTIKWPVKKKC